MQPRTHAFDNEQSTYNQCSIDFNVIVNTTDFNITKYYGFQCKWQTIDFTVTGNTIDLNVIVNTCTTDFNVSKILLLLM